MVFAHASEKDLNNRFLIYYGLRAQLGSPTLTIMIVYILKSERHGSYYVGMSSRPESRLKEHNDGRVKSTKGKGPWKMVHQEEFENRVEARKREKYLKSAAGRRFRKNILGL